MRPGQKELPSKYLYDEIGSSLFEVITRLPEYGLWRADERLLRRHADEIARAFTAAPATVAELGSGSGVKTRWILQALTRQREVTYHPIEISPAALANCERELSKINGVTVAGIEQPYLDGLAAVAARHSGEPLLVLFLGSTIGNFDRSAAVQFLLQARHLLAPGDGFLLGTDLEKPVTRVLPAYDDALGVTAAFNLNILARINRELDGNFDLRAFSHLARYGEAERRVEMHLMSSRDQHISVHKAGFEVQLGEGETIWTESSYKYDPAEVFQMAADAGFTVKAQWIDEEWPFAETLFVLDRHRR
jgi:dimethylhistidine N-methyltransferase